MNIIIPLLLLAASIGLLCAWVASRPRGQQLSALVNALPTEAYDPDNTITAHTSWLEFTPTGGSETTFKVKRIDYDGNSEMLRNTDAGADGVSRPVRITRTASTERFVLETNEYKKLATLLAGKMTTIIDGDAVLFIRAYGDADTDVAIKVATFACSLSRNNGANRFAAEGGDDAGTKAEIILESTAGADLVMTIDATA